MFRLGLRRFIPAIAAIIPLTDYDILPDTKSAAELIKQKQENETPMDRLYKMFTIDEFGILSPELTSIIHATSAAGVTGALYGGYMRSKVAYEDFLSNNQATSFPNVNEAKRQLSTQVSLGFAKGAYMWGWRLALFTFSYVGIVTVFSVYQDKSTIWEYLAAGSVTGALYKLKLGPKGMIVGGGVGLVLGAIAGTISLTLLYLTGSTMQEMRQLTYQLEETRHKAIREMKGGSKIEDILMDEHQKMLQETEQKDKEKKT
uniref:Complex I assembly factor TIMMDC1, mitochondrial n=1 Tax=Xenopsylla cheopis TaxID=163159 RepID=A0A6M2DJX7_XENCH